MGKVYEALSKAEMERRQSALSAFEPGGDGKHAQEELDERLQQFDFIDFSLSAPPASELERIEQEMVSASEARAQMARVSREATLDLARIDPHLVALYE